MSAPSFLRKWIHYKMHQVMQTMSHCLVQSCIQVRGYLLSALERKVAIDMLLKVSRLSAAIPTVQFASMTSRFHADMRRWFTKMVATLFAIWDH